MKKIFLINHLKPFCDAVESYFKNNGLEIYTHDTIIDCLYLVKDMNSDVVVIFEETILKDGLESLLELTSQIPVVVLSKNQSIFEGCQSLDLPIAPDEFYDAVCKKLESV